MKITCRSVLIGGCACIGEKICISIAPELPHMRNNCGGKFSTGLASWFWGSLRNGKISSSEGISLGSSSLVPLCKSYIITLARWLGGCSQFLSFGLLHDTLLTRVNFFVWSSKKKRAKSSINRAKIYYYSAISLPSCTDAVCKGSLLIIVFLHVFGVTIIKNIYLTFFDPKVGGFVLVERVDCVSYSQ